MIELQWVTHEAMTKAPTLQWRCKFAPLPSSGMLMETQWSAWQDVLTDAVPKREPWMPKDPGCWCARCDMEHNVMRTRMSICNKCGDKRCPRAEDHRNECSKTPNAELTGNQGRR